MLAAVRRIRGIRMVGLADLSVGGYVYENMGRRTLEEVELASFQEIIVRIHIRREEGPATARWEGAG